MTGPSILKARNKRFATRSTSTKRRSPGDKHRPISTLSSTKRWHERGRWSMRASPVLLALRFAKQPRRCAAKRKNVANDYVAGVTVLYNRERDIALAAYDGVAAAEAIVALAEAIHGANTAMVAQSLNSEAETLYEYGRDRGSNVHLIALIVLRRKLLTIASSDDERGIAQTQSRHCVVDARRARERHGAAGGGGRGLSRGAEGTDARARAARMGQDPEQSRHCVIEARRARERHGEARGGGRGLSRGAEGTDARARAARLGRDAEQSRHCVIERSASARAARRGSRRRSRPIARR